MFGGIGGLPGMSRGKENGPCCDCGTTTECFIIQGETDSFGYETNLFCPACLKKLREEIREALGMCDWCRKDGEKLFWTRDFDEGSYGPTYHVCLSCYKKQMEALRKEEESHQQDDYYW